ncbi:MAG TPA: hypothetical protein IAA21_10285 [Candidatus Blautia faecigallinarum]|uniref:Uncharacterized protein n=1 Tax=Candidatus Blautia faecigallinarum TaxID=2838488 RepID=A0A9D2DTY2_9FIRM|nr:hypothetical protein [Candidatus Blautia faecigallinarum]
MRRRVSCKDPFRERHTRWKCLSGAAAQDHLRAALIRSGDSVIISKVALSRIKASRVEPRIEFSSLTVSEDAVRDFLSHRKLRFYEIKKFTGNCVSMKEKTKGRRDLFKFKQIKITERGEKI